MVNNTWPAPGMVGYTELEIGANCTNGVFLPITANKSSLYPYPEIVRCEQDQKAIKVN